MKEKEYCVECNRDMSEIDNDHLHEKYHMLADRVAHMRMDINKIMNEYLGLMMNMKEDQKIIKTFLSEFKEFQKWTAKQALTDRVR